MPFVGSSTGGLPTKSSRPSRRTAYVGMGITLSDGEGQGERSPSRRYLRGRRAVQHDRTYRAEQVVLRAEVGQIWLEMGAPANPVVRNLGLDIGPI